MAYPYQHRIRSLPSISRATGDAIIGGLLVATGGGALALITLLQRGGAAWLLWIVLALLLGFVLLVYAAFIEPRILVTTKVTVPSALPAGLRIGIMSDIHVGPFKGSAFVRRAVRRLQTLKPDLIVLLGDFIFDELSDVALLAPLKELHAPLGVYAIFGNHDAGNYLHFDRPQHRPNRTGELKVYLESLGIRTLLNESLKLSHAGKDFAFAGIEDFWSTSCDIEGCLARVQKDLPLLLLSHNPDAALDHITSRADLMLCGHVHGGQVRLPFYGAVGVPAALGRRYAQGLFRFHEKTMVYITRGCGETLARVRFLCWPEVVLLETE